MYTLRTPFSSTLMASTADEVATNGTGDGASGGDAAAGAASPSTTTAQAAPAPTGLLAQLPGMLWRGFMIYMVYSTFIKAKPTNTNLPPVTDGGLVLDADAEDGGSAVVAQPRSGSHRCMWPQSTGMDLEVYLDEAPEFTSFGDTEKRIWSEFGLTFDSDAANLRETSVTVRPSAAVQANATLYAHVFLTRHGYAVDPSDEQSYDERSRLYKRIQMTRYVKRPKKATSTNLLTGEATVIHPLADVPDEMAHTYASMWVPSITLELVDDRNAYPGGGIPEQMANGMTFHSSGNYYPTLFVNEFWLLRDYLIPVNETISELPLNLTFSTTSLIKWQMMSQMQASFDAQETAMMGGADGETDEFKRMLLETNPILLGVTFVVSILHSVFDFLAFKNDVSFWKNKKSMEGMSVRTMFLNTFAQLIIFLYLLDNDTSFMILISCGIGVAIEFWKLQRACKVTVDAQFPFLHFEDDEGYAGSTKAFDDEAMKYLAWVLYPFLACYFVYSLIYNEHRGWYSFILSTLVSAIYLGGFLLMVPQLLINYRLKSVAHLPMRAFTYKFLSTIIDDLFAFIIKQPMASRIASFRDDIIFLIYLYQRWIYRVDKTRVNEYGQSFDESGKPAPIADADATAADGSPAIEASETKKDK